MSFREQASGEISAVSAVQCGQSKSHPATIGCCQSSQPARRRQWPQLAPLCGRPLLGLQAHTLCQVRRHINKSLCQTSLPMSPPSSSLPLPLLLLQPLTMSPSPLLSWFKYLASMTPNCITCHLCYSHYQCNNFEQMLWASWNCFFFFQISPFFPA